MPIHGITYGACRCGYGPAHGICQELAERYYDALDAGKTGHHVLLPEYLVQEAQRSKPWPPWIGKKSAKVWGQAQEAGVAAGLLNRSRLLG